MAYTNSPMVSYTNITDHRHSPRARAIDRITPHCIVGQVSAKWCVDYFVTVDREVSSNYVIGKDGEVGMSVEEKDRSWCSSSPSNDHRAITIECASDKVHPYTMNEKVFASLIELCADICKRNGKDVVVWIEDRAKALSYKQKSNEMLFTVHRWFSNTMCPGDWLYSRMGQLADAVNAKLQEDAKPNWMRILEEKTDSPDAWIAFVHDMKQHHLGKWLPQLIEKLTK